MLGMKVMVLALIASFALNSAGACEAKRGAGNTREANQSNQQNTPSNGQQPAPSETVSRDNLKTLAQGQQSRLSNAFIVAARDAETYAALRRLVAELPEMDKDFFTSNMVVAAFLGERRTGGYSVSFKLDGNGSLRIEESRPPKGSMTIQVITMPFSVVAVPLKDNETLALEAGAAWRARARSFRVGSGEFQMSGGIAGRTEKFEVAGLVGLLREGELVTLLFDLQSKGGTKPRALKDIASGLVQKDGRIAINRLSTGTFVDRPADALRASGTLMERRLSLTFESIPGRIADGFNGRGNLEAVGAASPSQKNGSSS